MPQGIDLMPAVLPGKRILELPNEREQESTPGQGGPYVVILYNCDCHTFEQVEEQLQKATGLYSRKSRGVCDRSRYDRPRHRLFRLG